MKKILFAITVLMFLADNWIVAGDITSEQARLQAQRFLQSRLQGGVGQRASAVAPQLKMAGRVNDLYVFNAVDGGFVIVSNDDCAEPVLGYSEHGMLDIQDIPDNMRAWLQFYADEIAWAKSRQDQPQTEIRTARRSHAVKTPIAPMLATKWNQTSPYSDQCPYMKVSGSGYVYSETEQKGFSNCAPGCGAVSMAQVMRYHEWPQEACKATEPYEWHEAGITLPSLPSTIFEWDKMLSSYKSTASPSEEAAAVAKLFKYCGYSTRMIYGPVSATYTPLIADALKKYFGYNATTTYLSRDDYSYANWLEIIYHELSEGRPVIYGGVSGGSGHSFVVDGYAEDDFFHINWGWGGKSDDFFKLSVLKPDVQGIGGSSSEEGYHYMQEAIVGVQKPGDTGAIAHVPSNNCKISLVSMTVSDNPTQRRPVAVTLRIQNSGEDDCDASIGYFYEMRQGEDWEWMGEKAKMYNIPAGATIDCTLSFTPQESATYRIRPFFANLFLSGYQETTVASAPPTSDAITLKRTFTVENSECVGDEQYNLYGRAFSGVLTISNPSSEADYRGVYLCTLSLMDGEEESDIMYEYGRNITVPANGSITLSITFSGICKGDVYWMKDSYDKDGGVTDDEVIATYTVQPSITTYTADGTCSVVKAVSDYTAPSTAAFVDLSGSGVITIHKNDNPNTFYLLDANDVVPEGIGNTVIQDGDTYQAENIMLTDGNAFYSPIEFLADKVVFNYQWTAPGNGVDGYNTLMLPFDVSQVTADGTPIDWAHSAGDTGKQFWLKAFSSDDQAVVNFSSVTGTSMTANTPYLVAFPIRQDIQFIGNNTTIHQTGTWSTVYGSHYRFIGHTTDTVQENIYTLNAAGNRFDLSSGSKAFRAYFLRGITNTTITSLAIGNDDETTGVDEVKGNMEEKEGDWFDLSGRRVMNPKRGVLIRRGEKRVIR